METIKIYRKVAKLKKIDMFYFDTQNHEKTILCLHGMYGRAETWVDFMNRYGKEYRIIAPDQRGHGLSSKPIARYTAEEMAEDIIELLDYLKIASVILVGHSMGGGTAGYLGAVYPDYIDALAILDMSANGPERRSTLPLEQLPTEAPFTKGWPMPFKSLQEAKNYIRQAAGSELEYHYFMNSLMETVEGYCMMFSSQAMAAYRTYYTNWYHLLPKIKCLVLLIRAKGSGAVSDKDFDKMQSLLSYCLAYEMKNPDHNVHIADKEEFYKYFDMFLEEYQSRLNGVL